MSRRLAFTPRRRCEPRPPADVPLILGFIRELAAYEQLEHQVVATESLLVEQLFGPHPAAEVVIAELNGAAVGFALVLPQLLDVSRTAGLVPRGPLRPAARARFGDRQGAARVTWPGWPSRAAAAAWTGTCSDWNAPAIGFYEKLGADVLPGLADVPGDRGSVAALAGNRRWRARASAAPRLREWVTIGRERHSVRSLIRDGPSLFDLPADDDGSYGGSRLAASLGIVVGWRRRGAAARGGAGAVSQLRAVGHHLARPARRPRRPQARPAPHPLHDVAAEPHGRRQASQVRQGRRRRDGQLPPARRHGDLRDAGAHGAVLLAALSAGGRLGQLRQPRRRLGRRDAVHRVPAGAHQRRAADRDRSGHRALPSQLRRHEDRAGRAAGAAAEPAGQRRHGHRRRHGHQHPAAQPGRGVPGAVEAARQPGPEHRAAVPVGEGPGLPHRRPDSQLRRRDQGDLPHGIRRGPRARHVGERARPRAPARRSSSPACRTW